MIKWKIYNEDAVEWAKNYQKGKFHALLTDAPYHLQSIVKRFGKKGSAPVKVDEFFNGNGQSKGSSPYSRTSKGFMGTQWDGGDVAFRPETWEAFGQVLYPGAFGMAFSASRNWHRMAVAIEDAGFIIHPTMFFLWVNGQGFPKATRVKGHEEFDGHRYGLQALKPAVEPIIVFQKPYEGKPVENIISTGSGALNIDGGRIPLNGDSYNINTFDDGAKPFGNGAGHKYTSRKVTNRTSNKFSGTAYNNGEEGHFRNGDTFADADPKGRWASNLILDEVSAEKLDEQTGTLKSGKFEPHHRIHSDWGYTGGERSDLPLSNTIGDSGGASRFFYQVSTQLDESDPSLYCAKVSPKERNAGLDEKNPHPTLKPIDLCKYLSTLLLPPVEYAPRRIFVPFSGSGSEMIGAGLAGWEHVVGVEFDKENGYVDIANKRLEHWLK